MTRDAIGLDECNSYLPISLGPDLAALCAYDTRLGRAARARAIEVVAPP